MKKIEIEIPDGKRAEWVNGVLTLVDDTPKEPNEVIKSYTDACKYLGLTEKHFIDRHIYALNLEAIDALDKLFLIAKAWNKEDEFVPDFSDWNQKKWFPWFKYDKDDKRFVLSATTSSPTYEYASAYFGSRLCFKTSERARQFGKQFSELYNKVFLS